MSWASSHPDMSPGVSNSCLSANKTLFKHRYGVWSDHVNGMARLDICAEYTGPSWKPSQTQVSKCSRSMPSIRNVPSLHVVCCSLLFTPKLNRSFSFTATKIPCLSFFFPFHLIHFFSGWSYLTSNQKIPKRFPFTLKTSQCLKRLFRKVISGQTHRY